MVKDKYIVYNLSLHMTETSCARGVRAVYTEDCKLRARSPTNYCEVDISSHVTRIRPSYTI